MADQRTWLTELRKRRGLSQEGLAEIGGVSATTPGRWERGVQDIRARNLAALAEAFGLSLRQMQEISGEVSSLAVEVDRRRTPPAEVALDPVSSLRAIVDGYRGLDHSVGPAGMLEIVESQLLVAKRLDRVVRTTADRKRLLRLVAEVHQLAGWMQFDMLEMSAARRSFAEARSAASEAQAPDLMAFVLGPSAAFAEADQGEAASGVDYAYAAIGHAQRSNNQRLIAFVHAIAARVHAKLGEERLALDALDRSTRSLELHDGWENDPVWLHVFDETALAGHSGSVELDLGRAEPAVELLDRQNANSNEIFVRNRAIWQLDRARALRDMGELEHATNEVVQALDLVTSTTSRRTESKLLNLAESVSGELGAKKADELRDALTALKDRADGGAS